MNFIEELQWRGMIHTTSQNGIEEQLKNMTTAYVGIDPTADSLHIGHLVSIMMLKHFQVAGHKPIILIGGATGMIGDPSGKSQERNLLSSDIIYNNQECIKKQLSKFLDFGNIPNNAEIVNNYDWMKDFSFLDFIRDIGKHITVNYMMSKESVKKRIETIGQGMSFTEFTYQLVQGNDFLHLFREKNCKLQMGGADQWGNMTTGTELISRLTGEKSFAITCPLITKSDGTKFGKTESGNIWLDPNKTSPFKFFQFWLNVSDVDAIKYIKIFTLLSKDEIDNLIFEHSKNTSLKILQKRLAELITLMIHGEEALQTAVNATNLLFGKGTITELKEMDSKTLLDVLDGVPTFTIDSNIINNIKLIDLLVDHCNIFQSKGDVRKLISSNGLSINKVKMSDVSHTINNNDFLNNQHLVVQKGKREYFIIIKK